MNEQILLAQLEERKAKLETRIALLKMPKLPKPEHVIRTCECGQRHYAKGKCYTHYMKDLRKVQTIVNDLGQYIGRKGQVLCDSEPACDYAMTQRFQGQNGKWYCSHHINEVGMTGNGKTDEKCPKGETTE